MAASAGISLFKQNKWTFLQYINRNNYFRRNYATPSSSASSSKHEVQHTFPNGKSISISSGQYARLADGCAVVSLGDTSVMVTAVSESSGSPQNSFLPLVVDYRQKAAAAGRIPTNFLRRELGPNEHEILTSRLIDRSMRPMFPGKYNFNTQIMCNLLSIDGIHEPDVLAINGASAALAISDIPWNGPVAAVRLGIIDKEVILNPTRRELQESELNLVVSAANKNLVVMLEGFGNNCNEPDVRKALKYGVKECQNIIKSIQNLQKLCGKEKRQFQPANVLPEEVINEMKAFAKPRLKDIFSNHSHNKLSRDVAINNLRNETIENIKSKFTDLADTTSLNTSFGEISKNVFRTLIFENDIRCDGRSLVDLRDISCQVDLFKPLHGSAMFQRGQTQVLCTVTLDSLDSALKMDTISMLASGVKEKNFFLHYEFPPYATNEIGKSGPIGRRELGHGALAERGLRSILPKDYPFTIRLTSEVLESNGSSSMASVCGGSLALMDAGVPISAPAAGVAMGLITKYSTEDETQVEDYRILTDLLGIEDYLGDMDFKIAGTKKGITAVQADVKVPGLPLKIVMESITQATDAKSQILSIMSKSIAHPRVNKKDNMPVSEIIDIPVHQRGKFLGVGGSNIRKIFVETGVQIQQHEDTTFTLFAPNQTAMDEAKEMVNKVVEQSKEPNLEFGGIYTAKIIEIKDIGVMITLYPTMPPALLHNSQLDQRLVNHPSALGLEVGQEIQVKFFGRDPVSGSMRLSRKVLQATNLAARNLSS